MAVVLEDIETALSGILLPQPKRSLPQLNMVRDIGVSEGSVKLTLALTVLSAAERERVQEWVLRTATALQELGVQRVGVSHCTGLPASVLLAQQLGEALFFNNTGTSITVP